ncbi:MAG: MFS transporter [Promethearchaeota archaeon]
MSDPLDKPRSLFAMISFSMADLHLALFSFVIGQFLLIFYETEVGLGIWYLVLGYIIYALWNAVNDPLIGFLTDKPRSYWDKWGKRFPVVMLGALPLIFSIAFIFIPPNWDPQTQPWFYFAWFVISTCAFDTFYSMVQTSHLAQYPELFRLDNDRRKSGSIMMAMGLLGTAIGAIVPGFIIVYYNRDSYGTMAWYLVGLGFLLFLLYIYGHREFPELKSRYFKDAESIRQDSFSSMLKTMFKQKNFMVVMLIFFLDSIIGLSLSASIAYVVKYDLQIEAIGATLVLAGFLLGAFGSIFLWLRFAQRLNNNRSMLIVGVFLNTIFLFPLMFFWDLLSLALFTILLGIGGGALRVGRNPVMADVIDEAVLKSGKRIEGSLMGLYTFFNRLAIIAQVLIFAIVHVLTGFDADPNATTQTPLALLGIRIHTALIPMVLCFLGLIVFYKIYDLTPKRTKEIQAQIKEAGL